MNFMLGSRILPALAVALVAALSSACVTSPPQPAPTKELQAAESGIVGAERTGAAQYAPQELRIAHEKLDTGRRAEQSGHMALAKRAAEQALADADLATARTKAAIARMEADKAKGATR
jgi:hypothetical protein